MHKHRVVFSFHVFNFWWIREGCCEMLSYRWMLVNWCVHLFSFLNQTLKDTIWIQITVDESKSSNWLLEGLKYSSPWTNENLRLVYNNVERCTCCFKIRACNSSRLDGVASTRRPLACTLLMSVFNTIVWLSHAFSLSASSFFWACTASTSL